MHCFTGSNNFSKRLIDLGAYFSLSGIITFKDSLELQNTARSIPLDKLLIETDSPFLAPVPKRGFSNEPSYIKYTAMKLAEIKNISFNKIIDYTSKNFLNLFSLSLWKLILQYLVVAVLLVYPELMVLGVCVIKKIKEILEQDALP